MKSKHYDECYFINYDAYEDIALQEVGCQKCLPSYGFGPVIRDNYVMHYILNGEGTMYLGEKEFRVSDKQAFITPPHLVTHYHADESNPWSYIWIHFNGPKAVELLAKAGITKNHPILSPNDAWPELEECMINILHNNGKELFCIGQVYKVFQILLDQSGRKKIPADPDGQPKYIKNAISFITHKFAEPIRVQDIANYCGLDRAYLSKVFRDITGYTLKEYLTWFRIKKAKQYLRQADISVQYASYAVGYQDPLAFSKLFKKETGLSPSEYKVNPQV
jgi:AraC family transcriptional regulator of arabinose operon